MPERRRESEPAPNLIEPFNAISPQMETSDTIIDRIKASLEKGKTVRLKVKINAGSGKNIITGNLGEDTLKIRISAAPEKGKANRELVEFLAKTFNIPRGNVTIVSGYTSPLKTIELAPAKAPD